MPPTLPPAPVPGMPLKDWWSSASTLSLIWTHGPLPSSSVKAVPCSLLPETTRHSLVVSVPRSVKLALGVLLFQLVVEVDARLTRLRLRASYCWPGDLAPRRADAEPLASAATRGFDAASASLHEQRRRQPLQALGSLQQADDDADHRDHQQEETKILHRL